MPSGQRSFDRVTLSPWTTFEETPSEVADLMSERGYSGLWDVSDEDWAAHVAPTIETLRAMPDADRPHLRETSHAVVVLQRR